MIKIGSIHSFDLDNRLITLKNNNKIVELRLLDFKIY